MSRSIPPLSGEVSALLDCERAIPPLPATVRARALARARAALVAGVERRIALAPVPRTRWAVAAAVVCLLTAALSAAAYQIRARFNSSPSPDPSSSSVVTRRPAVSAPSGPRAAVPPDAVPTLPAREIGKPVLSQAAVARAELRLLQQARTAVARQDYGAALPTIAEHARRFRDGRLSEEREALRVKALAGLGRMDEARRAAASFRARFPRSVLLPAVSQMPATLP